MFSWNSHLASYEFTIRLTVRLGAVTVSEAAKQAIWARHFLYVISKGSTYREASTIIYDDNQGAIKITINSIDHSKTKHIAVQYHAIQDHISNGEIHLEHLSPDKMFADGLTKATNHISQRWLVEDLGLAQVIRQGWRRHSTLCN